MTDGWFGYAASAWAIAYAIGVRGYHGLGGTLGVDGTFEDPASMRQASLIAGAGIFLVGVGALALVRPWDLLFYEPWFLGLAVLVTLGTLHYNRASGGSVSTERRLLIATTAATLF